MAERNPALPAIGVRMQDLARRMGVTGFWDWWTHELNALVPSAPRAALARRRMRPVLAFEGDHASLWRPTLEAGQAVMKVSTRIPLTGDAATVAAAGRAAFAPMTMTRMSYGGVLAPVRAVISLGARDVLRKRIVLPSAVEENLRQALAYDLDRHTPFKSEELYFDAAIVGRDTARGTVTIDLAAARRAVVDPLRKHAASWGVDVAAIVPESPHTASTSRLDLVPPEDRMSASPWARWQLWLPLGLLVVAALAAAVIPVWQKREYAIELNQLAGQARTQAAVSEALRAELDARVGDFNVVLDRKYAYPSALAVVDTVSKLLPDDTWLTQFELKTVAKGKEAQRELLLRGESANAGRLVALFEGSELFAQAAPRSPTTKIQPGPGEIFDLGAQLKPLPKPAPVPLAAVAAAGGEAAAATPGAGPAQPTVPAGRSPVATPATGTPRTPPAPGSGTPPAAASGGPPAVNAAVPPANPPSAEPRPMGAGKAPDAGSGGARSAASSGRPPGDHVSAPVPGNGGGARPPTPTRPATASAAQPGMTVDPAGAAGAAGPGGPGGMVRAPRPEPGGPAPTDALN
jgi:general secretion pathway protein L